MSSPLILTNKEKCTELNRTQLTITCPRSTIQVNVSRVDTSWSIDFPIEQFQFLFHKKGSKNIWKMKDART